MSSTSQTNRQNLAEQILNRRIVLPVYFAASVLAEEATAKDNRYFLRVRTQTGQLAHLIEETFCILDSDSDFEIMVE